MEGTAHSVVATEAKRDVGHASADLGAWAHALDLPCGTEEVHGIVVVLRQASADRQDVGVEDDVLVANTHARMGR